MKKSVTASGLVLTALLSFPVLAQDPPVSTRRIALPVEVDFEPVAASCVMHRQGRPEVIRGLFVPEDNNARVVQGGDSSTRTWIVCCAVPEGVAADGEVSVVLEREGQGATVRSVPADSFYEVEHMLDSEEKARQVLSKQREILSSYQVQLKTQQQALARLRNDADLLGEQGSLAARERQLTSAEQQIVALTRERANLEESVKLIRVQPAPLNSATIEVEMTRQLADMAQVARQAESTEGDRQLAGEQDLASRMRLIEESRFEDPEAIRAELVRLRRRRQELEESVRASGESPLDYE